MLKQHILKIAKHGQGGMRINTELFFKTCRAIEHFVAKTDPDKLYAANENPFRCPEFDAGSPTSPGGE